uniref:Uncharacterized protein n=1 Tax=viral metagenome TaxID=1070528 RepID=A0A6C0K2R2_9ZZZZ
MKLFPIQKIHPILLPPKQFKDRFGQPNAYLDMNPSLFIDPSGNTTVLIRRVNYRKFQDKNFTIYENQAKSEYLILKGHITKPFCTFFVEPLVAVLPQTYSTYWRGLEDIRFINETTVLATIPECHPKGQPALFQGTRKGNRIEDLQLLAPNKQPEKNWMPFGDHQVVYSVDPLQTKGVLDSALSPRALSALASEGLKGYHGSTNGIPWLGGWLFLIHVNRERTAHRWLWIGSGVQYSEEFVFFAHSYIEFPCSLCEYEGTLFVSLGVNDDKAFVLELEKEAVQLAPAC